MLLVERFKYLSLQAAVKPLPVGRWRWRLRFSAAQLYAFVGHRLFPRLAGRGCNHLRDIGGAGHHGVFTRRKWPTLNPTRFIMNARCRGRTRLGRVLSKPPDGVATMRVWEPPPNTHDGARQDCVVGDKGAR